MDNKITKKINFKSKFLDVMNHRYNFLLKRKKFKCYKKQNKIYLKIIEIFFLVYTFNFILLNINEISCESYIVVKINKSGRNKILYNGGVEDNKHNCYNVSMHMPNSMTINGNQIVPPVGEYEFTRDENTIKLYYDDSKTDYKCLFYGCSDIDEIDASHLITSNVYNMEYMFHQCNSLTSLDISNFNTEKVKK